MSTGNSIVTALKRLVEPQATMTLGGPGVGVRLRGTPIVADMDTTGPGLGVAPKAKTLGNLVDKIPGKRMDALADKIRKMPGRVFLGGEFSALAPHPTVGLSVGMDDKDKLKEQFGKLVHRKKKPKEKDDMKKVSNATQLGILAASDLDKQAIFNWFKPKQEHGLTPREDRRYQRNIRQGLRADDNLFQASTSQQSRDAEHMTDQIAPAIEQQVMNAPEQPGAVQFSKSTAKPAPVTQPDANFQTYDTSNGYTPGQAPTGTATVTQPAAKPAPASRPMTEGPRQSRRTGISYSMTRGGPVKGWKAPARKTAAFELGESATNAPAFKNPQWTLADALGTNIASNASGIEAKLKDSGYNLNDHMNTAGDMAKKELKRQDWKTKLKFTPELLRAIVGKPSKYAPKISDAVRNSGHNIPLSQMQGMAADGPEFAEFIRTKMMPSVMSALNLKST